jgi:uncharacterized membrane protein YfcA
MKKPILTILLGILAGIFGGSLGQSGAELMLPGLLILGIAKDFKTASGTVLMTLLPPIYILAVIEYYKRGQVQIMTSFLLMISFFIAAFVGARISKMINATYLEYTCGFYFLMISLFFFWNAYTKRFGFAFSH